MATDIMEHNSEPRPNYWWEYYGFAQDPYQTNTRNRSCYLSSQVERHLDLMQLLVRHSHEMLIIQGVKGAGKSTLIEHFLEQLSEDSPQCRIQATSEYSADDLINALAIAFDLTRESDGGNSVRVQLNGILEAIAQHEERCLLIVEDAQELPVPTLQALLYLQSQRVEHQAPIAIILSIENDFEERLQQLGDSYLDKAMIKVIRLAPFDLNETEAYIEYRFSAAGLSGDMPLSREDLIHIHQWSGGVPQRINNVTKQLMIDKLDSQEQDMELSFWQEHRAKIVGGTVLLIILIMGLYTWQTGEKYLEDGKSPTAANIQKNPNFTQEAQDAIASADQTAAATATATAENNEQLAINDDVVSATNPDSKPATNVIANDDSSIAYQLGTKERKMISSAALKVAADSAMQKTEQLASQAVDSSSAIQQYANTVIENPIESGRSNPNDPMQPAKITVPDHESIKTEVIAAAASKTSKQIVEHPKLAQAAASHVASNKTAIKVSKALAKALPAEKYLLSLPASNFTVQIIGLHDMNKINHYISEHQLGAKAHYFKTLIHGKPWYVLVYGHYHNASAAQQAIKQLPKAVRDQKPWVRTLASVHQVIKRNHS